MFCRQCKYDLRHLSTGACPECGESFDPDDPSTYRTSELPWWRCNLTRRFVKTTAAVLLGVYILGTIWGFVARYPFKQEWIWMDTVTGSRKYETLLVFGHETKPRIEQSDLELWLIRREGEIEHNWRKLRGNAENVWGGYVSSGPHAGGEGGLIINDLGFKDLLKRYLAESTDEQKEQFIQTMRSGTQKEQQLAVNGALVVARKSYEKQIQLYDKKNQSISKP